MNKYIVLLFCMLSQVFFVPDMHAQKKEKTNSSKKSKGKKSKDKALDSYFYGGKKGKGKSKKGGKGGNGEKIVDMRSILKNKGTNGEQSKSNANSGGNANSQTSYRPIYVGNKMVTGSISSNQGFRICLYTGNNREEAMAAKLNFMRRFANIRSYMSYNTPYYKIKVGDYAEKKAAQKALKEFTKTFPAAFIVPDVVTVKNILIYKRNQVIQQPEPEM